MPIFEYRCDKCGHTFDELETLAERDRPHTCPACGAGDAKRMFSVFATKGGGGGECSGTSCSSHNYT
jgi:putative FmdB family regulatory protein